MEVVGAALRGGAEEEGREAGAGAGAVAVGVGVGAETCRRAKRTMSVRAMTRREIAVQSVSLLLTPPTSSVSGSGSGPSIAHRRESYLLRMNCSTLLLATNRG